MACLEMVGNFIKRKTRAIKCQKKANEYSSGKNPSLLQASRIEDQRSYLPRLPPAPTVPDEDFFSLIQRIQSNRLDEQRTALPKLSDVKHKEAAGSGVAAAAAIVEPVAEKPSSSYRLFSRKKKSKKDKKK